MWFYVVMMRGCSVANGGVDTYSEAMKRAAEYAERWPQTDYTLVFFSKFGGV